jgi:hypothetical protein
VSVPTTPEFEWDAEKARENLKKHGVAFETVLAVFADPLGDPPGAAGGIGQTREGLAGFLQKLDQIDRTGKGVILEINRPVEVKQDGAVSGKVKRHAGSVGESRFCRECGG